MAYEKIKFTPYVGIAIDRFNVDNYTGKIQQLTRRIAEEIKKSRIVYFYNQDAQELYRVERRENGYKSLVAPGPGMPYTLEINGIHMHRIKEISPIEDSCLKVKAARIRKGQTVLDTCMGLGYTAICSLGKGAKVTTVEVDSDVIWIAKHNPYSRNLSQHNVTVIRGDITQVIKTFPDNSFDRIIHDPPRLTSRTGDLYSEKFYTELLRVLKPGGLLFHYTGYPKRTRGFNLMSRAMSKLVEMGFTPVRKDYRAQGVIVSKPISVGTL